MKLTGAIGEQSGFKITYSSNADAFNYNKAVEDGGAVYVLNPSDLSTVNMIKIEATSLFVAGDKVEFKVPLNVDVTFAIITAGNKVGTKNVYNPVYNMESTTFSGTLPRTKVGTELVIAEIGGTVFVDIITDDLPNVGDTYRGWVLNIDTTKPVAKIIGVRFLKYNPPVDLQLCIDPSEYSVKVGNNICDLIQ